MNVRIRNPIAVLRPRRQRLLLRIAVVVGYSPISRSRVLWLAVSVSVAITVAVAVVRLVGLRPLVVGRRGAADAAATAAEGFVGGPHGGEVGIPADELSARVGGRHRRRRRPSGVSSAGARVASALQREAGLDGEEMRQVRGEGRDAYAVGGRGGGHGGGAA